MKRSRLPHKVLSGRLAQLVVAGALIGATACTGSPEPLPSTEEQAALATTSTSVPTTSEVVPEPNEHVVYVQEALDRAEELFYKSEEVDWEPIREWAFGIVEDNPTTEGAHDAVDFALRALDAPHTWLIRPGQDEDRRTRRQPPSGERLDGDVGYLDLPGITHTDQAPEYAGQIRQVMEELEGGSGVCGWVLDLRESIGGSSIGDWLGLGPLVGDDLLMRFGRGSGAPTSVYYEDGRIRYEDESFSEREGEIQERVQPGAYEPESLDVPIAVLISSRTGSAGEAIAITFVGRPDTRFFGERTGGATTTSEFHEMADGAILRVAGGLYQDRTGQAYEDGLQPDTPVRSIRDSEDHVLNAAREWLDSRPPCD